MNQPSDNKEDWKNEKGVQDASYQDFVAPMIAGLGGIPRVIAALSKAPAIASALGAATPAIQKMAPELEDVGGTGTASREGIAELLAKWADSAQEMGDIPRMRIYKQLHLLLDQAQVSPTDVMEYALQIHADPQGL